MWEFTPWRKEGKHPRQRELRVQRSWERASHVRKAENTRVLGDPCSRGGGEGDRSQVAVMLRPWQLDNGRHRPSVLSRRYGMKIAFFRDHFCCHVRRVVHTCGDDPSDPWVRRVWCEVQSYQHHWELWEMHIVRPCSDPPSQIWRCVPESVFLGAPPGD